MTKRKCCFEGCGKKLDITAFPCKCEKYYCPLHRSSYDHGCSFDYNKSAKEQLLKYMSSPVVSQKVEAI